MMKSCNRILPFISVKESDTIFIVAASPRIFAAMLVVVTVRLPFGVGDETEVMTPIR